MRSKHTKCNTCGGRIVAKIHPTHGAQYEGTCSKCGEVQVTIDSGRTWYSTKTGKGRVMLAAFVWLCGIAGGMISAAVAA